MVGRDVLFEVRVRFHGHDVLDGGEGSLDEAVVLHDVCELGVENLGHQGLGGGRVVDLCIYPSCESKATFVCLDGGMEQCRLKQK